MQSWKISIITVCFNSKSTIEKTITSMLEQTYENYEFIIVDGGSKDGTIELIRNYESKFNGKLRWISEQDHGIYDAMNKGIEMATGDIVGIVNSDDFYERDALQIVADAYDGTGMTILYGFVRCLRDNQEIMTYLNSHTNIKNKMIGHPACFLTRDIYKKYGGFSMKYPYSADYELMLRLSKENDIHYVRIYQILTNYYLDGASSTVYGYRDTLKLRKDYGLITKSTYYSKMIRSCLSLLIARLKK